MCQKQAHTRTESIVQSPESHIVINPMPEVHPSQYSLQSRLPLHPTSLSLLHTIPPRPQEILLMRPSPSTNDLQRRRLRRRLFCTPVPIPGFVVAEQETPVAALVVEERGGRGRGGFARAGCSRGGAGVVGGGVAAAEHPGIGAFGQRGTGGGRRGWRLGLVFWGWA